jgi:serine/threonine protein kinase
MHDNKTKSRDQPSLLQTQGSPKDDAFLQVPGKTPPGRLSIITDSSNWSPESKRSSVISEDDSVLSSTSSKLIDSPLSGAFGRVPLVENSYNANRNGPIKAYKREICLDNARIVGQGSFSKVWKVRESTSGSDLAIKVPTSSKGQSSIILREARLLSRLVSKSPSHDLEGIINFYGSIEEIPAIVMEYYPYSAQSYIDLQKPKHILSEDVLIGRNLWLSWADQLCKGLEFIHSQGIIHCDIKSDNVFLDSELRPHIGDFSSARTTKELEDNVIDEELGPSISLSAFSIHFSAPELLADKRNRPTFSSDIFSLGLSLLHAATGKEPYQGAIKGVAQRMLWAKRGKPLQHLDETDYMKIRSIASILKSFLVDRKDLDTIHSTIHHSPNDGEDHM